VCTAGISGDPCQNDTHCQSTCNTANGRCRN
jgi:hypothetical protein